MDQNALILAHLDAANRQMERINSRLDEISKEGSERGRRIWEKVSAQGEQLVAISHRLGTVEESVAGAKPTLNQVINLRAKAEGAGWLGRKLLLIGTALLGAAGWLYSVRDTILHWFTAK